MPAQAGITSINLTPDATSIELPDGSMITGQTIFTRANGTTGTVANTVLSAEGYGYGVTQTATTDAQGTRTLVTKCFGASGELAYVFTSVTSASGNSVTNSYDDNGDGVIDRVQTILTSTSNGVKTEVLTNKDGGGILENQTTTTTETTAQGKLITISRDSQGGGWIDQREDRIIYNDGRRSVANDNRVVHARRAA
jgi:hypothetical protein